MTPKPWIFLHLTGIMLLLLSLGGAVFAAANRQNDRRLIAILHGTGLFIVAVTGVRMALNYSFISVFIWIKLVIWLILGGILAPIVREKMSKPVSLSLIIILTAAAAFMGLVKPA